VTEPTARTSLLAAVRPPRLLDREARRTATHCRAIPLHLEKFRVPACHRLPNAVRVQTSSAVGRRQGRRCADSLSARLEGSAESNLIFLGPSASFCPVHLDRPPRDASPNEVSANPYRWNSLGWPRGRARVCSKRRLQGQVSERDHGPWFSHCCGRTGSAPAGLAPAGSELVRIPGLQARPLGGGTSIGTGTLVAFPPFWPGGRRVLPRLLAPVDG
jgi:hypothetical protein